MSYLDKMREEMGMTQPTHVYKGKWSGKSVINMTILIRPNELFISESKLLYRYRQ
jgi:hypothetical protein